MGWFFRNPVLERLEDMLWEKARKRYLDEGGSPIEDAKELDKKIRGQFGDWIKALLAKEDGLLDPIWKEFKNTITAQTLDALWVALAQSDQHWFSVEKGTLPSFPDVIAVPYLVLLERTAETLPDLLATKIQFKDMLPETRAVLARYAVERKFGDVVKDARDDFKRFKIGGRSDSFIVLDHIKSDFYHLGERKESSRLDVLILGVFKTNLTDRDKSKHTGEKEAIKHWRAFIPSRKDDRRFSGVGWGLTQSQLDRMTT